MNELPMALRDLRSEFGRDDGGPGRLTGASWTYRSKLPRNVGVDPEYTGFRDGGAGQG